MRRARGNDIRHHRGRRFIQRRLSSRSARGFGVGRVVGRWLPYGSEHHLALPAAHGHVRCHPAARTFSCARGTPRMNRRTLVIGYILLVWFAISFVTNLIGPLMPTIINDFHLSLALAGFLPFSFFLAYGLISIPAGALVEARGPRATPLPGFALNLTGCRGL